MPHCPSLKEYILDINESKEKMPRRNSMPSKLNFNFKTELFYLLHFFATRGIKLVFFANPNNACMQNRY